MGEVRRLARGQHSAPRNHRRGFRSPWQRQVAAGIAVGLVAAALTTAGSAAGLLDPLHASALDALPWWKYLAPSPQIVVVGIDDLALARLRAPARIPKDYLASVIHGAQRSGARAIGLALELGPPGSPEQERALAAAIATARARGVPVVASYLATPDPASGAYGLPPVEPGGLPAGFANDPVESGPIVRRFRAVARSTDGTPLPSFALALLAATPGGIPPLAPAPDGSVRVTALAWRLRIGPARAPEPAPLVVPVGTWERIAYAGPSQTFLTVSSNALADAADDAEAGPRNPLRGKVVLIGPSFSQSGDRFRTPKGEMPGVEVQANIVHTLLIRNWETLTTWVWGFGAQSLVSVGGAALFASLHPVEAGLVALIAAAGGFVPLAYAVHGSGDYWVDLAIPLLAVFVGVRAIDRREQRRLQLSFARYVSPEVVTQVLRSRDTTLRAEQREVSILFCDLRGSTALGEKLSMDELVRLMNNYFEMVTQAVFRHGGMINKFIGDGILAVYNAPVDVPHHADAAVKTALEIHAEMAQLNQRWGDWLAARLAVGVGIHSGRVISGNVGSALRLEYTIIGDPVNVASRVEAMTKELGARILITDATRSRLAEYYPLRSLGAVPIRGRAEPIELFEIT